VSSLELFNLEWLNPWWLLLALAPLPLLWLKPRTSGLPRLELFIQRHLWAQVLSAPLQANKQKFTSFLLIWLLLCAALAGPFLSKPDQQQIETTAANIVVIVDISPSMAVQDVNPSRLEQAKKLLTNFSHTLNVHRLALVAYSANAYTVLPLSHDSHAFRHFLQQLDPSLAYVAGSNLGKALRLARENLTTDDQTGGLVLLISDGEIHDPEALHAASDLSKAGHKLISLGVGTAEGGPVPLAGGRLVRQQGKIFTSQLQRATLKQLAQTGGGYYFDLSPALWPQVKDKLSTEISQLQQSRYLSEIKTQMGQPLFPLLILLALIILFWQGLKQPQGLLIILTSVLMLNIDPADAAPWHEHKGLNQLKNNNNQGALETYSQLDNYTGLMGRGVAAYKLGQWQQALAAFEQAYRQTEDRQQKARAAYNQGNTLSQLQQLDQAIAAFELAVQLRGSYTRASHNLTLLNKAKQEWGGLKQAEQEQSPPGQDQTQDQIDTGAGGDSNTSPLSGQSQQSARLSETEGEQTGQRERQDASLSQSLANWSQMPELAEQPPTQAWQQYQNLKEDNQTMLQRRFEIEDKRALGRVEEKPW